jgi:predicted phosphoribosyltransferase
MIAALHAARAKQPARLVCAVPVAAVDSLERVRPYADEVVCLAAPADFYAVGQFYRDFQQVEDEEVVALLSTSVRQSPPR